MTINEIREMLGWCSLINVGLMILIFFMVCVWRKVMYKFHSKLFPMTEQQFNVVVYSFFGVYKLLIFVFNIVPYLALSIVTNG